VSGRPLAPFGRRLLTVTDNRRLGAYRLLCAADPDGPQPRAGQFAMLASAEHWGAGEDERPYLPRAFSYARWYDGQAQFLLEDVGPGTHRLGELQAGEGLWVLGPLGAGFTAPEQGRRALLVGGGVGIAPLAIWNDALGERATVLLGFRDAAHAEGAALLAGALVATDDGSLGHHGLVTELLAEQLDREAAVQPDDPAGAAGRGPSGLDATVYACGPPAMLEAVRALCEQRAVPAQLALEAGMACGFGACFGCVVPARAGGYLRVCVDGPVIDAQLLTHIDAHAGSPA
jgi:dihydroorotate dehydrogenase electron transfer subunit